MCEMSSSSRVSHCIVVHKHTRSHVTLPRRRLGTALQLARRPFEDQLECGDVAPHRRIQSLEAVEKGDGGFIGTGQTLTGHRFHDGRLERRGHDNPGRGIDVECVVPPRGEQPVQCVVFRCRSE